MYRAFHRSWHQTHYLANCAVARHRSLLAIARWQFQQQTSWWFFYPFLTNDFSVWGDGDFLFDKVCKASLQIRSAKKGSTGKLNFWSLIEVDFSIVNFAGMWFFTVILRTGLPRPQGVARCGSLLWDACAVRSVHRGHRFIFVIYTNGERYFPLRNGLMEPALPDPTLSLTETHTYPTYLERSQWVA